MALNLPGMPQTFKHSKTVDTGGGKERVGQSTVIVALDGTGDVSDIQSGIDLLPTGGGVVYIKEGEYVITKSISITSNNVALIGAGKSTKISTSNDMIIINAVGVTGCLIQNIFVHGSGEDHAFNSGIVFDTTTFSFINHCWIENCNGNDHGGAVSIQSNDNEVSDTFITNNSDVGLAVWVNNNLIVDNNISSNGSSAIECAGDLNQLSNNFIKSNTYGIKIEEGNKNIIAINTCNSNSLDGIHLTISDNNIVIGNQCESNTGDGILINENTCDKNLITGNTCLGNGGAAITDNGTNTHPNGASGTNNLALDDLNIIA